MAHQEQRIFLSLGSNEGDRLAIIQRACNLIGERVGPVVGRSSIYETEPWGMEGADPFLNQVIRVSSALSPEELLGVVLEVEQKLGRCRMPDKRPTSHVPRPSSHVLRSTSFVSRPIDIDILFYGQEVVETPELVIPHPHIADRRFVLVPLAEIAPEFVHQVLGKDMKRLLEHCVDTGKVSVWEVKT